MGTVRISQFNTGPATTFELEGDILSQSVSGNYTTVRCYLVAKNGPGGTTGSWVGGEGFQRGEIVGQGVFKTETRNPFLAQGYSNGATRWRLGPYDVRINHAADGTKQPIQFRMTLDYGGINQTLTSDSLSIPSIHRVSQATIDPTSFYAGDVVEITTHRASTTLTHDIVVQFGGIWSDIVRGAGAEHNWTTPLSWMERIPNATSGKGVIRVYTNSGSTRLGQVERSFTYRVPSSVVPTVSAVSVSDDNATVASKVGKLVKGLSRAKFSVSASGAYGSTIKTRQVTFQGQTITAGTAVAVTSSGASLAVTGRATDSRGRSGTRATTVEVLNYAPVKLTSLSARRSTSTGAASESGEYLAITVAGSAASLVNGTQRNSLRLRVFTRPAGGSVWTARQTISPTGLTYSGTVVVTGGAIYSELQSWDVRVDAIDEFGTYSATRTVSTARVALDMNGVNVGVGKIWEQGALDVAGDIYSTRIRLASGSDVSPTSTAHAFQIGPDNGSNLAIDDNEIMSRTNGDVANLGINRDGGHIFLSAAGFLTRVNGDFALLSDQNNVDLSGYLASAFSGDLRGSRSVNTITIYGSVSGSITSGDVTNISSTLPAAWRPPGDRNRIGAALGTGSRTGIAGMRPAGTLFVGQAAGNVWSNVQFTIVYTV